MAHHPSPIVIHIVGTEAAHAARYDGALAQVTRVSRGSSSNSNEEEEGEVKNIPSPRDLLLLVRTALARDTQQPT
jgi:hypothetical protein